MNKVFFDIILSGHHSEYIGHLVDHIVLDNKEDSYHFVVHTDFGQKFGEIVTKSEGAKNIEWHFITEAELKTVTNLSIIKSSFAQYALMEKYAKRLRADHVFLLYFNTFQFACIFKRSNFLMSGILFQQFYRMPRTSFKQKLKYWRKFITTKLYSLNPKLHSIFILNDYKTVGFLNKRFKTDIFKMLPDPVPILTPLENYSIHEDYGISPDRAIFLHFGNLGYRKGTLEIVESLANIPVERQSEIAILIIGRPENEGIKSSLQESIAVTKKKTDIQVILDIEFISNEKLKSVFEQVNTVLIPYRNSEASSGVLGHAIAAKKPVIAAATGLLKELIEDNSLGFLIDEVDPTDIADAILQRLNTDWISSNTRDYMESHSPEEFVKTIFA